MRARQLATTIILLFASTVVAQQRGKQPQLNQLMNAARKNDLAQVRKLLASGANVNERTNNGETALYEAIERLNLNSDNLPVVKGLLDAGADPNETSIFGSRPLMLSLTRDYGNPDVTLLLLRSGAHVPRGCDRDDSSVSIAAQNGSANVVDALLKGGAAVNCQAVGGQTAFHWAAMNGFVDVVSVLLKGGADPNLRNTEGKTPLDVAVVTNPDTRVQQQFARTRDLLQTALQNKNLPSSQVTVPKKQGVRGEI